MSTSSSRPARLLARTRARIACAALATAVAAFAMLAPGSAPAAPSSPIDQSKLWATINVCDTASRPDTIGLRASMPGTSSSDDMFMRFQVQYFSPKDGLWHSLAYGGDSGLVSVGTGRKAREAGRFFVLAPLADPTGYQLRGSVTFEWRRNGVTYRSLRRRTTPKHVSSAGADPAGFSAAICVID